MRWITSKLGLRTSPLRLYNPNGEVKDSVVPFQNLNDALRNLDSEVRDVEFEVLDVNGEVLDVEF